MDGRAPDVRQAKCAKTCAIAVEKPKAWRRRRRERRRPWRDRQYRCRKGSGTTFEHELPEIADHRARRGPCPDDFAPFRPGARVSSAVADRCPDAEPGAGGGAGAPAGDPGRGTRLAQQGDAGLPPTDYIRSIIAVPKPEQETCVAPCNSRAKS